MAYLAHWFLCSIPHRRISLSCYRCILQTSGSWNSAINISIYHNTKVWTYLCDTWHSYCLVQWQLITIHKPRVQEIPEGQRHQAQKNHSPCGLKPTPRQKVWWSHSQKLYSLLTQKRRNGLNICTDSYLTTKLHHTPLLVRHQPHSFSTGKYEMSSLN